MDEPQAIKFSYTDSTQNTSLSPLPILYHFNYYHPPPCYFFIILQSLLLPSSIMLLQGTGYIPAPSSNNPLSSNTSSNTPLSTATESIFHLNGINAQCNQSTDSETEGLTRNSWIYDSGSSWYICNNWNKMENVVQGEIRTTITVNGGKQSSDLFRSVKIIAKNTQGKSIIKLNEVMYTPESPCNIISNGIFKSKGLYLDGQHDIIHNGHQIVANCPILKGVNV